MNILLTNDDGIYAEGLWSVYRKFVEKHNVIVAAPDRERSGVSHSITLHDPIRINKVNVSNDMWGYAITGSPADCVKLAIKNIFEIKPDIVISGINAGSNVGVDINYSGTASAAKEASLHGISAIAVSTERGKTYHYDEISCFIETLTYKIIENPMPFGTILNVNFPNMPIKNTKGVKITRQKFEPIIDSLEERIDPRSSKYYWYGTDLQKIDENLEIDVTALLKGYITITPVKCDLTDYSLLKELQRWNF
ncbi:MAG: 5'/3'-nucleotidase SurE [Desulfobacterales bacterium]|nr:5'/3'-nucleotidase SurE [Desulfobacterales bacterium]MBF0396971.1 5'/3'-nucleotidase SurE [Desulfobacterales bacterium]